MTASLRHVAFLEALDTASDPTESAVLAAAYSLLVQIDRWVAGEVEIGLHNTLGLIETPREATTDFPIEFVERLSAALSTTTPSPEGRSRIAAILRDGARSLCSCIRYELALEVFRTALELTETESELSYQCHLDSAYAHRLLGNLIEAEAHYGTCAEIGRLIKRADLVFRAELGHARLTVMRGNYPAAETAFRGFIRQAEALERGDLLGLAHHELGCVAGMRDRPAEALDHFSAALRLVELADRDVVLNNFAYVHAATGDHDTALPIYLSIAKSATEKHVRLTARVNLIETFGALAKREEVEEQRRILERERLPSMIAADFWLTLGRAYIGLDDVAAARPCLEHASAVGHKAGMGWVIIAADEALARAVRRPLPQHSLVDGTAEGSIREQPTDRLESEVRFP